MYNPFSKKISRPDELRGRGIIPDTLTEKGVFKEKDIERMEADLKEQHLRFLKELDTHYHVLPQDVLIFGPGMAETKAVHDALKFAHPSNADIQVSVVDADKRVAKRVKKQFSGQVPVYTESFSDFLKKQSLEVDTVYIVNTGVTTHDETGINESNIDQLINMAGELIITRGDTGNLPSLLNQRTDLEHLTYFDSSMLNRGFDAWKVKKDS